MGNSKKWVIKTSKFVFVLALFEIIFLASFFGNVFRQSFFDGEFAELHPSGTVGGRDAIAMNREVLDYLRGKIPSLDPSFFDANEISHMADVKKIFMQLMEGLFINLGLFIAAAGILAFAGGWKLGRFITLVGITGIMLASFSLALGSFLFFGFDSFFVLLHSPFFSPGTWQFPAGSNLVTLYPEQVFFDIGLNFLVTVFIIGNFFIGIWLFSRIWRKNHGNHTSRLHH
ncbi:DUF1461 domain-containing protein [Candidatus Woesearchaeota archaeon]|nr:DUF1461 domain-containing protein [Candidatus Woesearchaeota archaeon]